MKNIKKPEASNKAKQYESKKSLSGKMSFLKGNISPIKTKKK